MAARAMWKGQLKVGTTKIPVKLYSAVQDKTVRFHILDDKNKVRVKQHMIDPDSGEEVPTDDQSNDGDDRDGLLARGERLESVGDAAYRRGEAVGHIRPASS